MSPPVHDTLPVIDVHAPGEPLPGLGRQHRVADHRVVRHRLAHHLDDDEAPARVARLADDVVQERHGGGRRARLDLDGRSGRVAEAALELPVDRVHLAVLQHLGDVRAHTRQVEVSSRGIDVVRERAHPHRVAGAGLHVHVVGEGDGRGIGLAPEHPDAHRSLARRAGAVGHPVAERHLAAMVGRARVGDGLAVGRDGRGAALGLGGDEVEFDGVAVRVGPEAVEGNRRGLAAEHAALERLGAGRPVGLVRDHGDVHRGGVGERRRSRGVDGVRDAVLPLLCGGEVAQHAAGAEGEGIRLLGRDRFRIERDRRAGGRDVVREHRDVDLRAGADDDGVIHRDRGELGGGRQQVDGRLALHARAVVVRAVAHRVVNGAEDAGGPRRRRSGHAEVVLADGVDLAGSPRRRRPPRPCSAAARAGSDWPPPRTRRPSRPPWGGRMR